ncbi:MAG: hypothetical protein ACTSXN_07380 [Promethearchaeota archaeon]
MIRYHFKSVSVENLDDLQEDFDSLNRKGVLSNHETYILKEIIRKPGSEIVKVRNQLHLKLLAVSSGIGTYGRNNICYIEGMGSFCTLHAYYTNYKMENDSWHELKMMDHCENCTYCN